MGEQSKTTGRIWIDLSEEEQAACLSGYREAHGTAPDFGFAPDRAWLEGYAAAPKVEREGLLSTSDLADLERLNEVFEDGQGWDIPKERMKRLAELGAVRWHGRTRYSITAFGMLCLGEGETPLRTVEEANAAAHARMLARNGIPAPAHGERREGQ